MIDCSLMILIKAVGKFALIWTGATDTIDRNRTLTYYEANDICGCLYPNMTLASIHSQEENDIIQEMMIEYMILPGFDTELGKDDLTIGLNRLDNPLRWQWSDGSIVDYANWEQVTRIEPDATDIYAQIDRQISSFTWFGRNSNPEVPFQRWFLCDTGIPFDDGGLGRKAESLFTLIFYPVLAFIILFIIVGALYQYRKILLLWCYGRWIGSTPPPENIEMKNEEEVINIM